MKKNVIRLNEGQLRKVIKESVVKILKEEFGGGQEQPFTGKLAEIVPQVEQALNSSLRRLYRNMEAMNDIFDPPFDSEKYMNMSDDYEEPEPDREKMIEASEKAAEYGERICDILNKILGGNRYTILGNDEYGEPMSITIVPTDCPYGSYAYGDPEEEDKFLGALMYALRKNVSFEQALMVKRKEGDERRAREVSDYERKRQTERDNKRNILKGTSNMSDKELDQINLKPVGKIDLSKVDPKAMNKKRW